MPGTGPTIPGTGTSEPSFEGESDTYAEYEEDTFYGGPTLEFGGPTNPGYTPPGPGGTGGGYGYSPPEDSSGDSSATPSYVTRQDPEMPNPEETFRSEYQALIDGDSWPITTLDEITTLVAPRMYIMDGEVISEKMSTKYAGCLATMEMVQEDSFIPNTGWNATNADFLFDRSWWPSYQTYATASIGIWRTPNCCTFTDPDQGVVQTYWATLYGHASQPRGGYTLKDPTLRNALYRNSGPDGSITSFGTQILPDPLEYTSAERSALKTKFGYTHLAGGEPLEECIYRLNRSLDNILDTLEAGFVPRTDVIKIVPRIKVENRTFERITQKENKQDVMIGQTMGNPNLSSNATTLSSRIAISTSRKIAVATMVPGGMGAVEYLGTGGGTTAPVVLDPETAGMGGGGMPGGATMAPAGAGATAPGPPLMLGGFVGGSAFPGPMGGPPGMGGGGGGGY